MSFKKEKEELVIDYFYKCREAFFVYYRDFMFPEIGRIPASMMKRISPTPATQSASPTQSLAEATEED